MLKNIANIFRNRRGQGLVEYGILVGGIALVSLASTAILGHKTNDLIATCAAVLPCAHNDDVGPIASGKLVSTTEDTNGVIALSAEPGSIEGNLGINGIATRVVEAEDLV